MKLHRRVVQQIHVYCSDYVLNNMAILRRTLLDTISQDFVMLRHLVAEISRFKFDNYRIIRTGASDLKRFVSGVYPYFLAILSSCFYDILPLDVQGKVAGDRTNEAFLSPEFSVTCGYLLIHEYSIIHVAFLLTWFNFKPSMGKELHPL